MAYVITELCTRDGSCVEVCPVECIVPGDKNGATWAAQFFIDPDTCIDCGACVPECPVDAIFPEDEVPGEYEPSIGENARFFSDGPGYWAFDLEEQRDRAR